MDNFTFGTFAELDTYEARAEFEAWLDSTEGDPAEWEEMTDEEFDLHPADLPEGFDDESEGDDWYLFVPEEEEV